MTKGIKKFRPLTSKDVCRIYEFLVKNGYVSFNLTPDSVSKTESIVSTIINVYFGNEIYKTPEEKAVAYMYFIIKDHVFPDGNKRTASLVFEIVCNLNGLTPDYGEYGLDALAVYIEKIKELDHQKIISILANIIFQTDKR